MVDSLIEWDVAQLTLPGEEQSGDCYWVKPFGTSVLVVVIDGLGHGDPAAAAAKIAVEALEANVRDSVISLFRRTHEALRQSRGAVMSMALIHGADATMTWMGVGNVEGLLVRASPDIKPRRESLLIRPGLLGGPLPPLDASVTPIRPGDTLVFATDGIHSGFDQAVNLRESPKEIAANIMSKFSKDSDDALVLVARYVGI
jgi:serine phosphatase RsbU (regulator of sigma subunit)